MSMCVRAMVITQFGMHPSTIVGDFHKHSIQLVHVLLSSWHNAILGTSVGQCYDFITKVRY